MAAKKKPAAARKRPPAAPVAQVLERLAAAIPEPRCELDHRDAWTLLLATILSAQSTDRTVNSVTPELFRRWPSPAALAAAPRAELEQTVHKTGFFRNKAKAIQECSQVLATAHGGQVPRTMEALVALPGVARKTANVVLGVAYRVAEGIVVDTHVMRVAGRLGLTTEVKAERIEADLCRLVPREHWIDAGHRLLLHGRYLCRAKDPDCEQCPLNEGCPARAVAASGTWQQRAARELSLVAGHGQA